jgi:catechol 2,3-dioxygenase-like lactoylglutathione lyase family enzyme
MTSPNSSPLEFGGIAPILRVENLDASVRFYTEVLGFKLHWRDGDGMASVGRGKGSIMLCEGDQGHAGTWLYIGVSDADALHEELLAKGATIRQPPANYPWGAREVHITDPDGHVLRFGSDAIPGEPIGDWIDGKGQRWAHQPDGSWRRVTEAG